ncbi:AMP-binding protein [Micromonospora rifamycinica]|uniref:Acyl-CoA synthetase (AMP-forming)/AMP-acid ligase II n=1 Tax=Micromonospora rifamycinica TaxID=291594 RepID=A0A109INW2_9ACTN|nr:AMP-binding protein [Micromonospora rifamycinica]KWV33999.1 AMP-dependent synthetase [Micromonospora rifamycinica]SCG48627.1 Acyl-CoA synthetase (AMP-forming)/AMP-acid ligase II [Micromonospora rifamycinica]
MTGLLGWLDRPDERRGIRFAEPDGSWRLWSYAELATLVRRYAAALRDAGVGAGDVVSIVETTGPRFVGLLFGSMVAGAAASPVAPPPPFGDRERWAGHLRGVLRASAPRLVVHDPALSLVAEVCAGEGVPAYDGEGLLTGAVADRRTPEPAGLALVQFTSGSSGLVRGVRVHHQALAATVAGIQRWLRMTPDDPTASWLPVHHDMGLVGCLLAPVATGSDLWLMSPGDFVRRPVRYLECFGLRGARLTAMPAFGLDHIVRRVPRAALAGMDFSGWRAVIVGAERIRPALLTEFARFTAPHGLRRAALLPAYGLAEATLSVTGVPLDTGWRTVTVEQGAVVGCGRPLADARVTVVDDDGRAVADGTVGEIVVRGPAVAAGYLPADADGTASGTRLADGELRTGDAGFLDDGELFVLGRLGDGVKVRGRMLLAEDVEATATAACGAPAGRITALLGQVGDAPRVVLLLVRPEPGWLPAARAAAEAVAEGVPVTALVVPPGVVARTSSGKPRRRLMWQDHLAGRLAATVPTAVPVAP